MAPSPSNRDTSHGARGFPAGLGLHGSTRQCLGCFSGAPAAPGAAGLPLRPRQLGKGLGGTAVGCGTGLPLPLLSPCPQNKSCHNASRSPQAQPAGLEEAVPPGEETPEVLLELLRDQHSPWALPPDCSPQDRLLREVAVLAPELLRGSRVFQVIKSLRILDKGVSASAGAHKAAGQEILSSSCQGKHVGKRTPWPPHGLPILLAAARVELLPTAS